MALNFLLFIVFFFPSLAQSKASEKSLMFGTGIANFSFMADKGDDSEASMSNKGHFNPYLGLTTKPRPFWSSVSWLRGSLEFSISPFKADRQNTSRLTGNDGKKPIGGVNLGTEVNGFVAYINPSLILFYEFGKNYYAYTGFGVGVGFASLKGDYFNVSGKDISSLCRSSSRSQDILANCQKEKVNYIGVGLSTNFMAVISLGWFGIRFESGGPTINSDGKRYSTFNSMFSIFGQYRF